MRVSFASLTSYHEIICGILSIPHNIVMDLNYVMICIAKMSCYNEESKADLYKINPSCTHSKRSVVVQTPILMCGYFWQPTQRNMAFITRGK